MKKVSIALVLLALLLMVVSMLWRRAIGIGEVSRPLPLSLHASQALPDPPSANAGVAAIEQAEQPRAIVLPAITLPTGCSGACGAFAVPRRQPVI